MDARVVLPRLRADTVELLGRMPWSSNATFLAVCTPSDGRDDAELQAIYKPRRGERPLWDFPMGLARREVAAYELSRALGWDLVPPTVLRHDLPLGEGSLQAFVPHDPDRHYFTLREEGDTLDDTFRTLCAFDVVANNTDRKSGHVLVDASGHVWAIDNGLAFHAEPKLRTVIWDFAGEPVPEALLDDLHRVVIDPPSLPPSLVELLDDEERDALVRRADHLVHRGRFPIDVSGHAYPWPLV